MKKGKVDYFKVGLVINLILFILAVVVSNALLGLLRPPMRDGITIWWEIKDQIYDFFYGAATFFHSLHQSAWGGVVVVYIWFLLYYSLGYYAERSLTVFGIVFFLGLITFLGGGLLWTSWATAVSTPGILSNSCYVDRGELRAFYAVAVFGSLVVIYILTLILGAIAEQVQGEILSG